jgi:hypothetical protein
MRLAGFMLALTLAGPVRGADPSPGPSATASPGASPPASRPLDSLILADGLWDAASQARLPYASIGFRWNSASKDTLESTARGLTLFDMPVTEALVRFEPGKPKEIEVIFYDRGDDGDLSKAEFAALQKSCEAAISKFSKTAPAALGRDAAAAVKMQEEEWSAPKSRLVLESSATREMISRGIPFRAEFIRLEIAPPEKPRTLLEEALAASSPAATAAFSGPSHVKKTDNGDVLIDGIPMVDQGEKGYCVVASTERVLRYYGQKVDQNELAEIANTSAAKGTDFAEMFEALKKLTARLHIRTKVEQMPDSKAFQTLFTEYNRAAKHEKADPLDIYGEGADIETVYHQMNFAILREVRTKNKMDLERFHKLVGTYVDAGIPLLWSVIVGLAPETPAIKGFGGHMRLIIGYNEKTQEILYSDSWGPGNELKRMPGADAWAITTGISVVQPL